MLDGQRPLTAHFYLVEWRYIERLEMLLACSEFFGTHPIAINETSAATRYRFLADTVLRKIFCPMASGRW